jgi:uncharacterized SAM-binding protein YcdF (DUF218 family)
MTLLIAIAKIIGAPGSIGFLAFSVVLGLAARRLNARFRPWTAIWFGLLIVGYVVMSLPVVANALADRVSLDKPLADLSPLRGVETLVVFDGDNRRGRVREAKRVFDEVKPRRVIVSGSDWLFDAVRQAGIPSQLAEQESRSRNTLEQLETLRHWPPHSVAVVASRLQMPRIALLARAIGVQPRLAPSWIDTEPPTMGVRLFVPTYIALRVSRDALYELMALSYYERWPPHAS